MLTGLGAEVVEVDLSMLEGFDAAATVLTWAEAGAVHERTFEPIRRGTRPRSARGSRSRSRRTAPTT